MKTRSRAEGSIKYKHAVLSLLLSGMLVATLSCSDRNSEDDTGIQLEEEFESLENSFNRQKEEFLADANTALDTIDQNIQELKSRKKNKPGGDVLDMLQRQRSALADKISELEHSGEDTWESMKQETHELIDSLEQDIGELLE